MINSIATLYDMVLCSRLKQWFIPSREQAGAQAKRGCLEHIVTLRLLIDFAKRKKQTLFVVWDPEIQNVQIITFDVTPLLSFC